MNLHKDLIKKNIYQKLKCLSFDPKLYTTAIRFGLGSETGRHSASIFASYGQNWNELVHDLRKMLIQQIATIKSLHSRNNVNEDKNEEEEDCFRNQMTIDLLRFSPNHHSKKKQQ